MKKYSLEKFKERKKNKKMVKLTVVTTIGIIVLIAKYKTNGLLAGISYIGLSALYLIAIRYTNAGHILLSKQCEVYINGHSHTRKILFTSDLGNIATQDSRIFVEDFQPVTSSNIVIGECTYASKERSVKIKDRNKDLEKIKSLV